MRTKYFLIIFLYFITLTQWASGQDRLDGSGLWFTHMETIESGPLACPSFIYMPQSTPTFSIIHKELKSGLNKLYNQEVKDESQLDSNGLCVGTSSQKDLSTYFKNEELSVLGNDGYIIRTVGNNVTIIIANTDLGALYGTYHYLRCLQTDNTHKANFDIVEIPSYQRRILNHWDNLDGTVERGYAGHSIWQWEDLPEKISPRYVEYAKANASIGINGTVLNNVNAKPDILKLEYLEKVKVLANTFRPYGIKVYLSINFSSPSALGGLENSDPLKEEVQNWWKEKANEIYSLIPDFGGFLVKANSEGLPGPQDFGRTHADGANMLADALKPHGGIVMWRAFVYNSSGNDRAKQAYDEFKPLDGKFRKNVILQVKNGPVDFQPREPFSPLFGALHQTTLMPELQITQEYLGFSDHLVYLGTLFKEFLNSDTYTNGRNSTVSIITDGSVYDDSITAIAGVANIGLDSNWCGHHFAQANWYAFGRLAWNHQLSARKIATEWLMQTFSHDPDFLNQMSGVMMESREAVVNYMTPLGLHHLMGWGHHYGPEPWCEISGARPDWLPTYYHKADSIGIGFNRSSSGSNAVSQYAEPLFSVYNDPALCPEELLLWFHHLPWNYELVNGRDLWTELCYRYSMGVEQVKYFQCTWNSLQSKVDKNRFNDVQNKLAIQLKEAIWWRDACLLYFQTFSHRPIPSQLDQPKYKLEDLKKLKFLKTHHN
ncbi:alpha-glucuronidase family glycosyl hydrolase [Labilibaculum euxinus]|uniref:Xylan alpha-1,2-glucuronidase n=1 Tax=Labilibaculum euxinus TaxID=2686357 RepID=A0A7M4D202_9BACT|nr:alpha-glucuronidase family glycosyl hydrolase [Labilibaculum euxinus]MUP36681.1 alpha-glucuronidase [Labilibaculum euxinus]MVB05886.1 alpha-glucuronidase [Labilibaculum euxinus]